MKTKKIGCEVRRAGCVLAVFGAALGATAADFYAKDNISDWTKAENFTMDEAGTIDATVVPGASADDADEVIVTGAKTVTIGDTASLARVNNLARIRPDLDAKIVFNIPEGAFWTNSCPVNYDGVNRTAYAGYGMMLKRGLGTLELVSPGTWVVGGYNVDYCTSLIAEEGVLILPQASPNNKVFFSYLNSVTNGATLVLHNPYTTQSALLDGGGLITNIASGPLSLMVSGAGRKLTFSGQINGNISMRQAAGTQLTGTNSTFSGGVVTFNNGGNYHTASGFTGVRKFGKTGEPSSIGTGSSFTFGYSGGGGAGYLCLREAGDPIDECDKSIHFYCHPNTVNYFDAGENGGVVFAGNFGRPYLEAGNMVTFGNIDLGLFGSNATAPAVFKGDIPRVSNNGTNYFFHLTQKGGLWRLDDAPVTPTVAVTNRNRTGLSAVTVEKGTFQFTSYARNYDLCCLGLGTNFMEGVHGLYDPTKEVDWQFALGSAAGEGALEYIGTDDMEGSSRPLVFRGDAKLLNSTAAQVRYVALPPETTEAMTLTLGGTGTRENEISDLVDTAAAPLSVVKEGAGKWVLGGNVTIHGDVHVKGGELVVRKYPAKYTWFKWVIKKPTQTTAAPALGNILQSHFFGLYDADTVCQTIGLTVNPNYAALQPGQAAYGSNRTINERTDKTGQLFQLFVDSTSCYIPELNKNSGFGWYAAYYRDPFNVNQIANPDEPSSWVPIVMRLTNGAPEVVAWDFVNYYGTQSKDKAGSNRHVGCYTIEGSPDGLHWDTLTGDSDKVVTEADMATANNCWISGGTDNRIFTTAGNGINHTYGVSCTAFSIPEDYHFTRTRPAGFSVFETVGTVTVDAGAKLTADGEGITLTSLSVAAAGAGTLSGFEFAAAGALDVTGAVPSSETLILDLTVEDSPSLANVTNWSLNRDGVADTKHRIRVLNDKIVISPPGMMFFVR